MGVVYHANYFTYYELGRLDLLKKIGYDYLDFEAQGIIYPVRNVSSTYLRSIRLNEEVYVYTKLKEVSRVQLTFEHIIKNSLGEIKSKGQTSIVSVDKETFRPMRMPEDITEIFSQNKGEE
jgi:acyl-CoA thioester hydrolase